jgi:hypothetical protein
MIINIPEIRIYLWGIVGQKVYQDSGQDPGVNFGSSSSS